jgi:glycine oxidase
MLRLANFESSLLGLLRMTKDAIIVGGGVIGCSIALRLARAGIKVAVIERGRVGCEASRAAAGMLSPQTEARGPGPFLDLCLRSRSMYREFAGLLGELSGINVEYKDEGTLSIALDGEDEEDMNQWSSWQAAAGLSIEVLSAEETRIIEPVVTQLASRAIFIPEDHQVDNRRLMDALDLACRRAGVEIVEGREATSLKIARGKAAGVICGDRHFDAGAVVVATGCWSSRLLKPAGIDVAITPARGQMIALSSESAQIARTIHSSKCYVVPRNDGRILVGATVEHVGFHKANTAGGVNSLLAAAIEIAPSLHECEIVEMWSGLRPDTPDHLPGLGSCGVDNLLLATGHFRNGILLAPVTAELIAELLINSRTPEELKPFSPDRFEKTTAASSQQPRRI